MRVFNKVAIIGVGLIGGSIGLAIKSKGLAKEVIGVARKKQSLKDALKLKAVDKATQNIIEAVKGADLVILCQPIETIISSFARISPFLKNSAIVTDVGSCKEEIVKAAKKSLPKNVFFVGAHPLAGSEKRGINFASRVIFQNSLCILTPTTDTNKNALKIIREFWRELGAKTFILKPQEHDRIVAFISHLPHMLAFSLINSVPHTYLKFSSSGLKDTTRIALSSPEIWRDICLSNSKQILISLNQFEAALKDLKRQISKHNPSGLMKAFSKAQKIRANLNAC